MLQGMPTEFGIFNIKVKLTDSTGVMVDKSYTLTLAPADALTFNSTGFPDGNAGTYYATTLSVSGGVPPRKFFVTERLPAGLSLDSSTGTLSGTPRESGTFNLTLKLTDSIGVTAYKTYTLNIAASTLTLITTTLPEGYIGSKYSTTFTAYGGVSPRTIRLTGTLPTGLSYNTSTGVISGTPSVAGLTNLNFSVTDYSYPTAQTASVTLPLRIWNSLSISTTSIPDGYQKTAYSITLSGMGITPHSWSITTGTLPNGIILDNSTGTIAGTPATCGAFPFTARLTDAAATPKSVDKALTLNVACSNDYIISGNAGAAGATVNYSGTASGSVTADSSGNYSIGPLLNGTYTITPSKPTYIFNPVSRSVTVNNLDFLVAAFAAGLDPTAPILTLIFSGLGGGSVSGDIACISGEACSSKAFVKDTMAILLAKPDNISLFGGWTGDCSGTGNCSLTLSANKFVHAAFNLADKAKIGGIGYASFDDAYNAAAPNSTTTIMLLEDALPINTAINKPLVLQGGHLPNFTRSTGGSTTLQGNLTIRSGSVVVDRIVLK
jgi:hypothetical protein